MFLWASNSMESMEAQGHMRKTQQRCLATILINGVPSGMASYTRVLSWQLCSSQESAVGLWVQVATVASDNVVGSVVPKPLQWNPGVSPTSVSSTWVLSIHGLGLEDNIRACKELFLQWFLPAPCHKPPIWSFLGSELSSLELCQSTSTALALLLEGKFKEFEPQLHHPVHGS